MKDQFIIIILSVALSVPVSYAIISIFDLIIK